MTRKVTQSSEASGVKSKYVAKCLKKDLRNSSFEVAHRLCRPPSQGEWPWKYLTSEQLYQVQRYRINTLELSQQDYDFLNRRSTKVDKQKVIVRLPKAYEKTIVYYRDEDGSNKCEFKSHDEALDFINHNIARVSSGEKFELEDIIDMYKLV
jgi:hypothetical protein